MKKRTTYIDGLKLGQYHAIKLLELVNKKITECNNRDIKKDENYPVPKELKDFRAFSYIAKQLHTFLAQWENVQLGDKVEFKPKIIVMKNLFELNKPDPITETEKNSKQLEFNFDFNQDQPLLVELNK